jgi:hypothetical protein
MTAIMMRHHIVWWMITNALEERAATFFRLEMEAVLRDIVEHVADYTASYPRKLTTYLSHIFHSCYGAEN